MKIKITKASENAMKKFVAYNKMSKKTRREIEKQRRVLWQIDPKTKIVPSKYKQKKYAPENDLTDYYDK